MALQTLKKDSVIKKNTLDFRNDRYNLSSQNELLMFYPFSADLFVISLKTLCGKGVFGTSCAALHATVDIGIAQFLCCTFCIGVQIITIPFAN